MSESILFLSVRALTCNLGHCRLFGLHVHASQVVGQNQNRFYFVYLPAWLMLIDLRSLYQQVRQFMSGIKNYLVQTGEENLSRIIDRERTKVRLH